MNKLYDIDINKFFTFSHINSTRNPEGKLFQKHAPTNRRKYSFTNRVVAIWNTLPSNYKSAQNINEFKNLLDNDPKLQEIFLDYD